MNIRDIFSAGDKVTVRLTITNRQVKEFEGLPPSDPKQSVEGAVIWRVEDGKVAESWAFPDTHGLLDELGLTFPQLLWTIPRVLLRKLLP